MVRNSRTRGRWLSSRSRCALARALDGALDGAQTASKPLRAGEMGTMVAVRALVGVADSASAAGQARELAAEAAAPRIRFEPKRCLGEEEASAVDCDISETVCAIS
jgi:hypothetical protein